MVSKVDGKKLSPAMAQFHRFKQEYPNEILFFQMGDFFEMFYEDAKTVSRVLGLALTSRSKGADAIPMAGVPVKSVDQYLKKLVSLGHRVAICDQIQDPRDADGVVERAVTRIVTAGTITEEDLLDRSAPNYLAALHVEASGRAGLACLDLSTGQFLVNECDLEDLPDALSRLKPAELLLSETLAQERRLPPADRDGGPALTTRPDWQFDRTSALATLCEHFEVAGLDGFGLDAHSPGVVAAGAALRYLQDTQKTALTHLNPPRLEVDCDRLILDRATQSCLELIGTARDGRRDGALLTVLDETVTAPGARRLRAWLLAPLRDLKAIHLRQAAVEELVAERAARDALRKLLRRVIDLERLLTRVVTNRAGPRDLVHLRQSLLILPELLALLFERNAAELCGVLDRIDPLPELTSLLQAALSDDPPLGAGEGGLIKDGYRAELDELRSIHRDGRKFIAGYQAEEVERTGIQNLRVGFNRVFGFYIEVTNSSRERVPSDYLRKQTLKNAERYITPRLKDYETRVLGAEDSANRLEAELFQELRAAVISRLATLKQSAGALADLDALLSLAEVAARHGYVRPEVDDSHTLSIEAGRHPVLAALIGASVFVPNDCRADGRDRRLSIVTGPNMAGKSTYIRQVAILQIMAQMGSFVPARSARFGVADRVFARVGASDDLTRGNSTFMVEMSETANILNNATDRSLVILDEVGRGTSTFDGLALAWAISEHLLNTNRARTLFATHYHQLIDLAATHSGVVNLNVAVREWGDEIVFLHQIVEGGSDRSYGIHVARLAGVPKAVLERATLILRDLEQHQPDLDPRSSPAEPERPAIRSQQTLFEPLEKALLRELKELDPANLTPLQALQKLTDWKERHGPA